jgi:polyketide-type polyunsaturated fatty acid synthase PfaA
MADRRIAIIGKAGIFAKAPDVETYWRNIVNKVDGITEVPSSRWRIEDYYDPDPDAPDKTYCKRGGFIPDVDFNPLEFGMPPNMLEVTDVSQLLGLVVARDVLEDAGYGVTRAYDWDRVGVVLGISGGLKLLKPLSARLQYPIWERVLRESGLPDSDIEAIVRKMKLAYVDWNENAFPGLLGNVVAGRIANRFDLGGMNATIDAACASSLAAVEVAVNELAAGRTDMMISGGVDTDNSPFTFMCFSKTPAFSKDGKIRPFDADADGMLAGEGIGMVVLKRLEDAERDGDRIYAVVRGVGASSDGRYKSIYAPRPEGQAKAVRRAYEDAEVEPESVDLIEAHGTGTMAGDPAEMDGLRMVFKPNGRGQHIAVGSVKSQIGHTKGAAGAASLIKVAMALHHKVLPPTLNVTQPNPKINLADTPFYINTELRPWIRPEGSGPRRAGVSAFGFGGTNYHLVLEEYERDHEGQYRVHGTGRGILLDAPTPSALIDRCEVTLEDVAAPEGDAAYATLVAESRERVVPQDAARVGFVAGSRDEAIERLESAIALLRRDPEAEAWEHPKGIYFRRTGLSSEGVVALFPGQGSQFLNMGRDLAVNFPPVRELYAKMDARFLQEGERPLSEVVFPPPAFEEETEKVQDLALRATDYAQAAIGVTSAGILKILTQAGFRPDFTAGHSFGELSALWAGGVLDEETFLDLVKARGRAMAPPDDSKQRDAGTMLAVTGPLAEIEKAVEALEDVVIANQNSPSQVVLAGPTPAIEHAASVLPENGFEVRALPVSAAFHTALVEHASGPFAQAIAAVDFDRQRIPVYSNTTGARYPDDPSEAKDVLAQHILHPVVFKTQIENLYESGGRIFVEVGPRRIVTNLVNDILQDKPHLAVPLCASRRKSSDLQLRLAVIQLRVAGLPLKGVDPYALSQIEIQEDIADIKDTASEPERVETLVGMRRS